MERDVDCCIEPDESLPIPHAQFDGGASASALSCSLTLDGVGEVLLSFNSDGLSWKSLEPFDNVQIYRFTVHGFQQSKALPSLLVLAAYTFGHKDLQTCQMLVEQINASLALEQGRPKNLLVFVHPRSGKGNGCKIKIQCSS